jgi:hypothetical protein
VKTKTMPRIAIPGNPRIEIIVTGEPVRGVSVQICQ